MKLLNKIFCLPPCRLAALPPVMTLKKRFTFATLILIILTLVGCATAPPPPPEIYWPLPPDEPRIKYVGSYKSKYDFPRTSGERIAEILFGKETLRLAVIKPYGGATDSRGRIFVADSGLGGLLVIDPQKRSLDLWGRTGQVRLALPLGVALDAQENVYVSDNGIKKVAVYNPEGEFLYTIGNKGDFVSLAGIAVDKVRQHLIVTDVKAHKVKIYDLKGKFINEIIGSEGKGWYLFGPTNVAVSKEGNLYVVDSLDNRVLIFDAEGKYLRTFGEQGTGFGNFVRPKGIAVDSEGHIYVVDAAFENFQIFTPEGQLLLFVGAAGVGPGEFSLPAGIWIDKNDRIYVTDQMLYTRVQIFQYLKK